MSPNYLQFIEQRLEIGVDYGVSGVLDWNVTILRNNNGGESRSKPRSLPIGKWQLGNRKIYQSELTQVIQLETFFRERNGSYEGFRFKDWTDYKATLSQIGVGDGVKNTFQLVKRYQVGTYYFDRPIPKPVAGTISLFVDTVPVTGTVNTTNGLVTLDATPTSGALVTATFEFDIPVWFDPQTQSFPLQFQTYDKDTGEAIYSLGNLQVIEGSVDFGLEVPENEIFPRPLTFATEEDRFWEVYIRDPKFNLGFFDGSTGMVQTENRTYQRAAWRKTELDSGFKRVLRLPNRLIDDSQLSDILNYWWVCKGQLIEFELIYKDENYIVRFDTNPSFKFVIKSDANESAFYEVSGLSFIGDRFKRETLTFSGGAAGILHSFTLTANPSFNIPAHADIYLYASTWDKEGTLEEYNTLEVPNGESGYYINMGFEGDPPFTGGQCEGTNYRVEGKFTSQNLSGSGGCGVEREFWAETFGAISGVTNDGVGTFWYVVTTAPGKPGIKGRINGVDSSAGIIFTDPPCVNFSSPFFGNNAFVTNVVPITGLDNCGDPPSQGSNAGVVVNSPRIFVGKGDSVDGTVIDDKSPTSDANFIGAFIFTY